MIAVSVMPYGAFASFEEYKAHANVVTAWGIFSTRTGLRFVGNLTLAPKDALRLIAGCRVAS